MSSFRWSLFWVLPILLALGCDDDLAPADADVDSDIDADGDGDGDSDADGDVESDGDIDATAGDDADIPGDADTTEDAEADADEPVEPDAPAVFRAPDEAPVCGPTPPDPCTPSDMAWVATEYGSEVRRAEAAGEVYRLVEIAERVGPSSIDVFVVDGGGAPLEGITVAFTWPDAPNPSRPDEWYPGKVTATTDDRGRAGFSLAASAYLSSCGGGGPHAIWVSMQGATPDTSIPSDLADRLGMLGGTNHRHLDLMFQRQVVGEASIDPVRCPL